jgi:hypothetical protein
MNNEPEAPGAAPAAQAENENPRGVPEAPEPAMAGAEPEAAPAPAAEGEMQMAANEPEAPAAARENGETEAPAERAGSAEAPPEQLAAAQEATGPSEGMAEAAAHGEAGRACGARRHGRGRLTRGGGGTCGTGFCR